MQAFDRDETYRLMSDLLKGIQIGIADELIKFGVTRDIFEEIEDELRRSGVAAEDLNLPPHDLAFVPDNTGRIPFDIFETDADSRSRRIACQLWAEGRKAELTLMADWSVMQGKASLVFRLLEMQ
ncbi:hypothetical protein EGY31_15515 [Burkholderia multivorans]|uniref:hypothetical protein n=1 Tax=Burkholderia ubonensis TaxID=101571 RepID=UPI000F713AA4|nr:hypothetical protein [Burkholderia ubonensis]AYZ64741.1 hypothetical protein EGY31_15515 [Burkholderia multivorans]VWB44149.1 hypothetical protein BUB20358_01970 [Burkholderia ubonensis]